MDWTRQVKIVLRLQRKRKDGVEAEADHIADGQGLGDAGDPVPEVEDVPPGLEVDDLGRGTDTVRKRNVHDPGPEKSGGAEVEGGPEARQGLEEVVAILEPGTQDLGQGRGMIRKSPRRIKIEIRTEIRKGVKIRIIKRTGMKVIRKRKRKSLTEGVSLRKRTQRNEEDLVPVHILGKSDRLATRRNVPRAKRRRRIIVTGSPVWTV